MTPTDFRSAHEEWGYREVESEFWAGRTLPVSIPCQLRFTETAEQDVDRFHDAARDRGWAPLSEYPERNYAGDTPRYDGKVCSKDHYNRVRVLAFRNECVRLFPHDDYIPTLDELIHLVSAIETGFDAPLEHDPMGTDGD